jgi:hypothetical protein
VVVAIATIGLTNPVTDGDMSKTKIEKLTPEQEALIPVYREKWRRIVLSTDAIDRQKASNAVKAAYELMGYGF